MDQVKIEKFISDERKAKGYTQKQLSELLGISDKQYRNGSVEFPIVKDTTPKIANPRLYDTA